MLRRTPFFECIRISNNVFELSQKDAEYATKVCVCVNRFLEADYGDKSLMTREDLLSKLKTYGTYNTNKGVLLIYSAGGINCCVEMMDTCKHILSKSRASSATAVTLLCPSTLYEQMLKDKALKKGTGLPEDIKELRSLMGVYAKDMVFPHNTKLSNYFRVTKEKSEGMVADGVSIDTICARNVRSITVDAEDLRTLESEDVELDFSIEEEDCEKFDSFTLDIETQSGYVPYSMFISPIQDDDGEYKFVVNIREGDKENGVVRMFYIPMLGNEIEVTQHMSCAQCKNRNDTGVCKFDCHGNEECRQYNNFLVDVSEDSIETIHLSVQFLARLIKSLAKGMIDMEE